jgi:hypothetical protein
MLQCSLQRFAAGDSSENRVTSKLVKISSAIAESGLVDTVEENDLLEIDKYSAEK